MPLVTVMPVSQSYTHSSRKRPGFGWAFARHFTEHSSLLYRVIQHSCYSYTLLNIRKYLEYSGINSGVTSNNRHAMFHGARHGGTVHVYATRSTLAARCMLCASSIQIASHTSHETTPGCCLTITSHALPPTRNSLLGWWRVRWCTHSYSVDIICEQIYINTKVFSNLYLCRVYSNLSKGILVKGLG